LYKIANMGQTEKNDAANPNKWRYRSSAARVVIIFTDASYHEPLAEPRGAQLDDVVTALMSNRIILSTFAPDMPCYAKLSEVDKAEWNIITGGSTPQESLASFTSNRENFRETMKQLAKTVSKTAEVPLL